MRLIDAEAKIKMLLFDEMYEEQITREMTVEEALDLYTEDGCPTTVDAEPVRHGHWIKVGCSFFGVSRYECSVCHYTDEHNESREVPYCWHCGALMKGVEE